MRYCQILISLSGLSFALYGLYCLVEPQALASALGVEQPSVALLSEVHAMYGGLQLWLGLLLLYLTWYKGWLHGAMAVYLSAILALVLPRSIVALSSGSYGDPYVQMALIFEWSTVLLLLIGSWLLRRERHQASIS